MKPRFFLLLSMMAAVVLTAMPACTGIATVLGQERAYEALQRERWLYQTGRRGQPPTNPVWALFRMEKGRRITLIEKPQGPSLQWANLGRNTSGQIRAYAFDPFDSRTIWVGSAGGGLWKTTDRGENWQPMTDGLFGMAVSAVAVHPRDANTLLIGTEDLFEGNTPLEALRDGHKRFGVGVLRSTDGGQTWNGTSLYGSDTQMNCNALAWDPVDPQNVYLAGSNGVWKSTDAGETWRLVLEGNARTIVLDKKEPATLYTALALPIDTTDVTGVWKSTDYGETWTTLAEGLPADAAYSTDCGACMALTISDRFPQVLYLVIQTSQGDRLYKTSDGGAYWQTIYPVDEDSDSLGFWTATVSPVDPNVVFVGGVDLYRTLDGGASWEPAEQLERPDPLYIAVLRDTAAWRVHVDHHAFAYDPEDPNRVYAFTDGGVFQSDSLGQRWVVRNGRAETGLMTLQMYSLNSARADTNQVAASTQDQGQLFLNRRGPLNRWKKWLTGDGIHALYDHQDPYIIYAMAQKGNHWRISVLRDSLLKLTPEDVYRIQDGIEGSTGQTEDEGLVMSPGMWATPQVMHPVHSHVIYTSTTDSVYKTTWADSTSEERGAYQVRWRALAPIESVSVLVLDQVNPRIVYAYSSKENASSLWRSDDAGQTWLSLAEAAWPDSNVSDLEADPDQQGTLYATRAGYSDQVWRSRDRGRTWENITHNLPAVPVNTIALIPNAFTQGERIFVGTDVGVYAASEDPQGRGLRWSLIQGNLPHTVVTEIHFHPGDATLRVGTYGRGAWIAKLPR